ncbi:MAG: hypothetical protein JOZ69_19235 [Myxococcales bacterium]|nr:hypothetical protein [Myxococcales bacterium]
MANGEMRFMLQVANSSFSTVLLSDVTVRYWFSADSNPLSTITAVSDFSQNGNNQNFTKLSVVAAPAANVGPTSDTYVEFSFATTAGPLAALGAAATIQVRVDGRATSGMQEIFNETNDWSFLATAKCGNSTAMFTSDPNITAYVKGMLVFGCEPSGGGAVSSSGGAPQAGPGGPPDATASDARSGG